jgi:DNA-binding response OmpR family regulator
VAGFDVHLAKPIDPSELLIVIARLVSRQRIVTQASGDGSAGAASPVT